MSNRPRSRNAARRAPSRIIPRSSHRVSTVGIFAAIHVDIGCLSLVLELFTRRHTRCLIAGGATRNYHRRSSRCSGSMSPCLALRMNHGFPLASAYARRRFHSVEQYRSFAAAGRSSFVFTHPSNITVRAVDINADDLAPRSHCARPTPQLPSRARLRTIAPLHLDLRRSIEDDRNSAPSNPPVRGPAASRKAFVPPWPGPGFGWCGTAADDATACHDQAAYLVSWV